MGAHSQARMNVNDTLKSPALRKEAVTFATGYARRMRESQYPRLMSTELGKQASRLSKPSQNAVGAVLNPNSEIRTGGTGHLFGFRSSGLMCEIERAVRLQIDG